MIRPGFAERIVAPDRPLPLGEVGRCGESRGLNIDYRVLDRYRGREGYGEPHDTILNRTGLQAQPAWRQTVDASMLDEQVRFTPETAPYLYPAQPPAPVGYTHGSRPLIETLAAGVTALAPTPAQQTLSLARWIQARCTEGPYTGAPECLTEEELLVCPFRLCCNLCARLFCMMSQTLQIPTRMVFLYSSFRAISGFCQHVVAEAFIDGRWSVVDASVGRMYVDRDSRFASAWQIHRQPSIVSHSLTAVERAVTNEVSGPLDARLYSQFAICTYSIHDSRPARTDDRLLGSRWTEPKECP